MRRREEERWRGKREIGEGQKRQSKRRMRKRDRKRHSPAQNKQGGKTNDRD